MVDASGALLCGQCGIVSTSHPSVRRVSSVYHFCGSKANKKRLRELSSLLLFSSGRSTSFFCSKGDRGPLQKLWHDSSTSQQPGISAENSSERGTRQQAPKGGRLLLKIGGLRNATKFACKDAKIMSAAAQNLDQRARKDLTILKKGILRLDTRARQDVALIGSGFLKLDARAREDTEKLDMQARQKVKRLRLIALGLQEVARVEAEEHWSNGALDADLRLADLRARRRAMEDAYTSIQAIKTLHDTLVRIVRMREDQSVPNFTRSELKALKDTGDVKSEFNTGSLALDRLLELEEAYFNVASLLAETESVDYDGPDELEFIVATLLDMDEVDGRSGASLLAECATSPDVETRRALADALANAPSLWTLGNAGMGALQKLAKDSNPVVAAAATRALQELNDQLQAEDSFFLPEKFSSRGSSDLEDDSDDS